MISPTTSFHETSVSLLPSGSGAPLVPERGGWGRAPLFYVAVVFSIGIGCAWWLKPAVFLLFGLLVGLGLVFWRSRENLLLANGFMVAFVVALGALRAFCDGAVPPNSVARILTSTPQPMVCEGMLASDVEWKKPISSPAYRQGWVAVERIKQSDCWSPVCGDLFVRFPALGPLLAYGDRLLLSGSVRQADGNWFWLHGALGRLSISGSDGVRVLGFDRSPWTCFRRWVGHLRGELRDIGRSLLGPEEAAYLEALLLGERQGLGREVEESFRKTGTIHVLVVSGLQVGLIGAFSLIVFSFARLPRTPRYLLVVGVLLVYGILAGGTPPILRAMVMGILFCLGRLGGHRVSPMNSLGLAALLILVAQPRALADPSFQLSFAAVLGLLTLSPWIGKRLEPLSSIPLSKPVLQGIAVSCGAWAATFPFVAWHFHMVTPIALAANLVIVPWSTLLTACGFLLYLAGSLHLGAASLCAAAFSPLCHGFAGAVEWFARIPGGSWTWGL